MSCFHGNQSSIFDPIKDHQNNSITSLKLFEWLHKVKTLKKVVYAAGCAVAEKVWKSKCNNRRGTVHCFTTALTQFPS